MSVCRDFGGASCQPDRLHFYAFASIGGAGPNAMLEILTGSCSRLALWHPDSINIPQHECCWTCFGHGALSTGRSVEGLHASVSQLSRDGKVGRPPRAGAHGQQTQSTQHRDPGFGKFCLWRLYSFALICIHWQHQ